MSVSIIIPVFNDNFYLNKILEDIKDQNFPHNEIQVIIIEAGENQESKIKKLFHGLEIDFDYLHVYGLNRNASLNLGFSKSKNQYLIRLDARTHIKPDYISNLVSLSEKTGFTNVGGVKVPIGEEYDQKLIARVMKDPFCLGGANFRKKDFEGLADTVYLGCYKKEDIFNKVKFEEKLIRISEDADLNYNLSKNGKKTYVSSKIKAYYYCRETIGKFLGLMFNYGVSRGLFIIKNKTITSLRQIILPVSLFNCLVLFLLGLVNINFFYLLSIIILVYLLLISSVSILNNKKSFKNMIKYGSCLAGTHIAWTLGFYYSLYLYFTY